MIPHCHTGQKREAPAARPTLPAKHDGRVYGTWDFKWPRAVEDDQVRIRVAFQQLPEALQVALSNFQLDPEDFLDAGENLETGQAGPYYIEDEPQPKARARFTDDEKRTYNLANERGFALIKKMVQCVANRWIVPGSRISFVFLDDDLPPPQPRAGDEMRRSKSAPVGPNDRTYDALISLCDLPLVTIREELTEAGLAIPREAVQFLPGSELGRYAQRIDYGVPTTYLGRREFFPKASTEEYFKSHELVHWVIHESGHMLGLTHEHQNPNLIGRIQSASNAALADETARIASDLSTALGYRGGSPITVREIEEEISTPWPVVRDANGNILFSDFRPYPDGAPCDDSSSALFHVYWRRILGHANAPPRFYFRPHDRDIEHLRVVYG